MFTPILIALLILFITAFICARMMHLPKNIWILFVAQPLVASASPIIVFIGGIVATQLSDDPSIATVPITLMILGVASASIPAAMVAKRKGRRFAALLGFSFTLFATFIAMLALVFSNFIAFMCASLFFGVSTAFVHQLRFAAIESAQSAEDVPKILSILMLSGLFAAFLGPEIAVAGKDLFSTDYPFVGSFLCLSALIILAMLVMLSFKNTPVETQTFDGEARPLSTIVKQPVFIIAIGSAAIGYALMSYLMTATPLSMHHVNGHSLASTKWVIQSHIAAMFLPSLFTAWLVKKVGLKVLLLSGSIIYVVVAVIAFSGEEVLHYWWALLLLGIGWNFLFLTGTTLLPQSYNNAERHKVQATNDFILFGFQAFASLMAGWVLFKAGWNSLVLSSLPFVVALFILSFYWYKQDQKLEERKLLARGS